MVEQLGDVMIRIDPPCFEAKDENPSKAFSPIWLYLEVQQTVLKHDHAKSLYDVGLLPWTPI